MLTDHYMTVAFYSVPDLSGGGKPFVATPETSATQSFKLDPEAPVDFFALRPASAYAFRIIPHFVYTHNQGLRDEEYTQTVAVEDTPLCFFGGAHLDKAAVKDLFGVRSKKAKALRAFGEEFIVTKDDVLIPFEPEWDELLQFEDGAWEKSPSSRPSQP